MLILWALISLLLACTCQAWNHGRFDRKNFPAISNGLFKRQDHPLLNKLQPAATLFAVHLVCFGQVPTIHIQESTTTVRIVSSAAVADSTGKMSTKLTAKKRYLPRVVAGVGYVNDLLKNPSDKAAVDKFVTDELPSLKRAMNLYGASLRKGEVPDEISREAEQLTDDFYAEAAKLSGVANKGGDVAQQLGVVKSKMDAYVKFAKIEL